MSASSGPAGPARTPLAAPSAGQTPLPFEETIELLVERAGAKLRSQVPQTLPLLSPQALSQAERDLLGLLCGICAQPLLIALCVFRQGAPLSPLHSDDPYAEFAKRLRTGALDAFFREYPVLGRLVETCIGNWIDAHARFLRRLQQDRPLLIERFGVSAAGPVAGLEASLSDRHGGASVIGVTFASGLKLAYKPRGMKLERLYFDLLQWLNDHGAPCGFRTLQVIERPGYGWCEWAAQEPCQDERQMSDYFARAGALQCLLWLLHSTDAHMGNVIAAGAWPVLVDAECLLQPQRDASPDDQASSGVFEDLLCAKFIPGPRHPAGGPDLSGLFGRGGPTPQFRVPAWEHLGTGRMSLRFVPAALVAQANRARIADRDADPASYGEPFASGYAEMYRFLEGCRDRLLAPGGPLEPMFGCRARVLLRSTRDYVAIVNRSLRPALLRDKTRRAGRLRQQLLRRAPPSWDAAVLDAEAAALEELNIPYFSAPVGGVSLSAPVASSSTGGASPSAGGAAAASWSDRVLDPRYFETSGEQMLRSRLAALGGAQLAEHLRALPVIFALARIER